MNKKYDPQVVIAELRKQIEYHRRILKKLEKQESRISAELNATVAILAGKDDPIVSRATMNAKQAVLSVVEGMEEPFSLKEIHDIIETRGIEVEGANPYKRISSALLLLSRRDGVLERIEYGKYRLKHSK